MPSQRAIVVGTAGHIDHGKTSLVKALTGVDTDRLEEEKRRGITIELGFAPLDLVDGVHIAFVDVPGHERFIKNMLAGAGGVDAVLLVVAADESIMPQTREHIEICNLLGIEEAVVAITKSDLVDEETIELVTLEISELIEQTGFAGAPIVPVSSTTADGLDILKVKLAGLGDKARLGDSYLPRLPVDRVFTIKGFGTVVTGTLISGRLQAGTAAEFSPSGKRISIKGLQVHGESVESVSAGHRVAVNVSGVPVDEIPRGEILTLPSAIEPTAILDLHCRMIDSSPCALEQNQRVRFHLGSGELLGRVAILAGGEIKQGQEGFIRIRLEKRVSALIGDHYVIRRYSPMVTIGGGIVLDNKPPPARKRKHAVISRLKAMKSADTRKRAQLILEHQEGTLSVAGLSKRLGLLEDKSKEIFAAIVKSGIAVIVSESPLQVCSTIYFEKIQDGILQSLQAFHERNPLAPGVSLETLRNKVTSVEEEPVFRTAMDNLQTQNSAKIIGRLAALADFNVDLTERQHSVSESISSAFKRAGASPPTPSTVIAGQDDADAQALFDLLASKEELVRLAHDFYLHRDVLSDLTQELRSKVDKESFSVPEFKEWFDISRKYAIPLLEYLDAKGITFREGDVRRLRK